MSTTDEKLDELKELFTSAVTTLKELFTGAVITLKEAQEDNRRTVKRLEEEIAATKSHYKDMTERVMRFASRQRPSDFNRKGHEEQYFFNLGI